MKGASQWGAAGSASVIFLAVVCFAMPFGSPVLEAYLRFCSPILRLIGKVFSLLGYYGDQYFGLAIVSWYICCAVLLGALGFVAGVVCSKVAKSR